MYLIFKSKQKAQQILEAINAKEGAPDWQKKIKTATKVIPDNNDKQYAVPVKHLKHRAYINNMKSDADKVFDELTEEFYGSTGFLVEMLDLAQKYHANTGIFQSAFRRH